MTGIDSMSAATKTSLERVANDLHQRFRGSFGFKTIEALVFDNYAELATTATIDRWLVVGAERFAEQRLQALIHADDRSTARVPGVVFLCVHNSGRSQWELHNLTADPEERHNRARDAKSVLSSMKSVLDEERDAKRRIPLLRDTAS
jgi:arylsulfatase A-like enzyme